MDEAAGSRGGGGVLRRGAVFAMLLAIFALLTLPVFIGGARNSALTIERGQTHAPVDLATGASVTLAGQWRIRLEVPAPPRDGLLAVPRPWQGATLDDGSTMPALAQARYSLVLHDVPAGDYRLYLQPVFIVSRVAIDGGAPSDGGLGGAKNFRQQTFV